jgi:formate dehydrogenase accessory protein FdhE
MTPAAEARIARARLLAADRPSCARILGFYAALVALQQALITSTPVPTRADVSSFAEAIDIDAVATHVPRFLGWLRGTADRPLAETSSALDAVPAEAWLHMLAGYWSAEATGEHIDDRRLFVVESLLQPFAERIAQEWRPRDSIDRGPDGSGRCPICGGQPGVAVLREQGHGARRSLVCGLCLTEFPAQRIVCLSCGQNAFDALPIYRADTLPGVRVDACDACRAYIKTIDLTQSALANPVVDDLASLPLDLWAREQGYRQLRPNLLRV